MLSPFPFALLPYIQLCLSHTLSDTCSARIFTLLGLAPSINKMLRLSSRPKEKTSKFERLYALMTVDCLLIECLREATVWKQGTIFDSMLRFV